MGYHVQHRAGQPTAVAEPGAAERRGHRVLEKVLRSGPEAEGQCGGVAAMRVDQEYSAAGGADSGERAEPRRQSGLEQQEQLEAEQCAVVSWIYHLEHWLLHT